jgi:hypothetical protein
MIEWLLQPISFDRLLSSWSVSVSLSELRTQKKEATKYKYDTLEVSLFICSSSEYDTLWREGCEGRRSVRDDQMMKGRTRWRGEGSLASRVSARAKKRNTVCSLWVGFSTPERIPFPAHPAPAGHVRWGGMVTVTIVNSDERIWGRPFLALPWSQLVRPIYRWPFRADEKEGIRRCVLSKFEKARIVVHYHFSHRTRIGFNGQTYKLLGITSQSYINITYLYIY